MLIFFRTLYLNLNMCSITIPDTDRNGLRRPSMPIVDITNRARARARRLPPLTANHDRATVAEGAVTTDNTSTFIVYGGCSSKTCSSRTSGGGGGRGPFKNIFSPENYSGSVVRQRLVRARFVIVTAYAGELSRGAR